jgi:hypothetical protein
MCSELHSPPPSPSPSLLPSPTPSLPVSQVPAISVDTTLLDFGQVFRGSGKPLVVMLYSTGTADLHITSVRVMPDARNFQPTGCTSSGPPNTTVLPSGSMCQITITFAPTDLGPLKATLVVSHNVPNVDTRITLTGTGAAQIRTSGSRTILVGQSFDLDDGRVYGGSDLSADISVSAIYGILPGTKPSYQITPMSGARMGATRSAAVSPDQCASTQLGTVGIVPTVGSTFCVRTNQNRWSAITVEAIPPSNASPSTAFFKIDYTTWE